METTLRPAAGAHPFSGAEPFVAHGREVASPSPVGRALLLDELAGAIGPRDGAGASSRVACVVNMAEGMDDTTLLPDAEIAAR